MTNVAKVITIISNFTLFFYRDSNDKLSASRSLCHLSFKGLLVNNFMLDRTASSSTMYF